MTSELDKSEGTRQESKLNENNLTAKLVLIADRKQFPVSFDHDTKLL